MILVPNHLRLLSGSKLLLAITLLLSISLQSCFSSKSSTYRPPSKPERTPEVVKPDVEEKVEEKVVEAEEKTEEIVEDTEIDLRKSSYNLKLILPFQSSEVNAQEKVLQEDTYQNQFINFYLGTLMAIDRLESQGMQLNLEVHDSNFDPAKVTNVLDQSKYALPDAVIGPFAGKCVKVAAEFAKNNETLVISPHWASSNTTERNPYYIQLKEPLSSQFQYMVKTTEKRFNPSDVYIIQTNSKMSKRVNYLQKIHRDNNHGVATAFKVINVDESAFITGENVFDELFATSGQKVILLPYYLAKEELTVYNILRRLHAEKGLEPVTVIGLDMIIESNKIDFSLLNNLDVEIITSNFADSSDPKIKRFRQEYYNRYSAIPNKYAIEGYDIMMYVGTALQEYGVAFPYKMSQPVDLLQTEINLYAEPVEGTALDGKESNINYYQNDFLKLVKFQDGRFQSNMR